MANFFARARVYVLIVSLGFLALPARAASVPELSVRVSDLRSPKPPVRIEAANALVAAGAQAVPDLVAGMREPRLRPLALKVLARIGAKAVPALIDLLENADLRENAAGALAMVAGPESSDRAARLLACARVPALANACGTALLKVAPKAGKHAPLVIKALDDSDAVVRAFAAGALGQMDSKPSSAVEPLTKALADRDAGVRMAAAVALGRFGRKAKTAVPALTSLSTDSNSEVRSAANEALKTIND